MIDIRRAWPGNYMISYVLFLHNNILIIKLLLVIAWLLLIPAAARWCHEIRWARRPHGRTGQLPVASL